VPDLLPGPNSNLEALQRFAAIKLIVADLDGTLFPSELAGTAQRLLRQLNRAGVRLTIATGRTFSGVQALFAKAHANSERLLIKRGTPLILYNGSVVVEALTGQLLSCRTIPEPSLRDILKIASSHRCEVFAYSCGQALLRKLGAGILEERVLGWQFPAPHEHRDPVEFNGLPVTWEPAYPFGDEPCAVLLRSPTAQSLSALRREMHAVADVSATQSGSLYIELRPAGSNKAVALAWTAQHLGVTPEQVLTVGDNDNDVEMLEWAGVGVAVCTASDAARSHADYICQFGPFQGVVEVLRLVHQAHRYFRVTPAVEQTGT
jgi:Cof subfamily protein (haloacid dehalogenase superfamily)